MGEVEPKDIGSKERDEFLAKIHQADQSVESAGQIMTASRKEAKKFIKDINGYCRR